MAKFDRSKMKKELLMRTKESHDRKDDSGKYRSYLIDDLPRPKWKNPEGEHAVDIIPFIAGPNHPQVAEGHPAYNLEVWVHFGVGVNENQYVCMSRTYGQRCPICEKQSKMRDSGEYTDDEIKDLNPKRRCVYNVVVYDSPAEEEKGVQIFEVSHFYFEKHIAELAKRPRGGGFIAIADPDDGRMVCFTKKGTRLQTEFLGHRLEPREIDGEKYVIEDEILEQAVALDTLIREPDIEEMERAMSGAEDKEEKTSTTSRFSGRRKPKEQEEEAEEVESEEESSEEEAEEEAEEKPKKSGRAGFGRGKSKPKPKKKEKEEDDSSDDNECPHGHEYGVDVDKEKECRNCEKWDDCFDANQELNGD